MPNISIEMVRRALALREPDFDPRAAQLKMVPQSRQVRPSPGANPRLAATLLLLYPHDDQLHFILTRRPDTFRNHAGQISFPGGRQEPDETFQKTALRETCEEVGVCGDEVQILGRLSDLYIPPSDFLVHPFVGYLPQRYTWKIREAEVAEIIETPLNIILDDGIKQTGEREFRGITFEYMWYDIQGHEVWGATAIMLSELEWRLRTVLAD